MRAIQNEAHNNAGLAYDLSDLLKEFSIETQKQFEQLSGTIEDANKSGLLDPENYEQLMKREKFDSAYTELVERACMDLSMKMMRYLDDLGKKLEEYNNIKI